MSTYVPAELRRRVREYFDECCAYCRTAERLAVAIFEIEHIVPRAAGGETAFGNLCFACPSCNRYKATRTLLFDELTSQEFSIFHPHDDRWSDHFRWSEDTTEIIA